MSSGAVFTMRLKDVLETTGGTWEIVDGISRLTGGNIGLDHYPLFSDGKPRTGENAVPDYRPILNGKIFDHYMNMEIGYESIGMFQQGMRRTMNEIMPFYNQMYESLSVEINPLSTTSLHTDNTMTDLQVANQTAESTNSSSSGGSARTVQSDTPQTQLEGAEDYASGAVDTNSQNATAGTGNQVNSSTTTDNASGVTNITGYQGAASDLLMRFRESFINPDMMVINDLKIQELFIGVWDNGDSFTNNYYNFYI